MSRLSPRNRLISMRSSSRWRRRSASRLFTAAAPSSRHTEPLVHDRARRGVLQMHLLRRVLILGDRKRRERRLVEAAQDQLLLAGIGVDVADREDPGLAGLELRGVDVDRLLLEREPPFRDRTEFRMQTEEYEHLI